MIAAQWAVHLRAQRDQNGVIIRIHAPPEDRHVPADGREGNAGLGRRPEKRARKDVHIECNGGHSREGVATTR
ncbi:hypothetical protein GCM10012284_30190 [Mangrovihabitans endophyticus]|uniref:Uncharacterized protein n=1 Tax=Mangrovihabitans endophyticus TaxID=1751298 RepID=A0A8J3C175_9ACTN|nr:hypothetical protein GCM10012284_30190 [Mangrovihabitans endophyticus]